MTDAVGSDLLERGRELLLINEALDAAVRSTGALLLIDGAAGTGKSRLLDVTDELATAGGHRVLKARCSDLESGFAFGAVLQLLEPVVTGLSRRERTDLFQGAARPADALFSGGTGTTQPAGSAHALFPLIHGLYWVMVTLAGDRPIVVLVDDAHCCDDASLRFLAYLARRLDGLRVAFVVSSRSDAHASRSPALDEVYAEPRAQRSPLGPLSDSAVTALIRQNLSPDAATEFCASCAHATGGNPFLLHELLQELKTGGYATGPGDAARIERLVPPTVLRAVMARIARLPEGSVEIARAAAVLGRQATVQRCEQITGLDPETTGIAADALVAAGLFDSRAETTFSHPLIRSTVQSDMPAIAQARTHRKAARILNDQGEPVEIVAAHIMEAGTGLDEVWAFDALRRAAKRSLAGGDPRKATDLLERARTEGIPLDLHGVLLTELGEAQALSAHPDALATLEEALAHTAERLARAAIHRRRGDLMFAQNRPQDAVAEYNRGLAGIDSASREARELEAERAVVQCIVPGGIEQALASAGAITAREGEDTPAERSLLAQIALRMALTGEPREKTRAFALRAWADGALLAEEGPDGNVWSLVTGALSFSGYSAESILILDRVIEASQQVGSVLAFATASYSRSGPLYWSGRVEEAAADAQRALDARADGWSAWLGSASSLLTRCLIERGQLEEAAAMLEEPDDPRWAQTIEGLTVLDARACLGLARGRYEEALSDYVLLGERCETVFGIGSPVIMPWHSGAALAALHLGDGCQAAELNDAGLELARRLGAPGPVGRSTVIAGMVRVAGGDTAGGLVLMSEGVQIMAGAEAQLDYAFGLVELGATLRRANRGAAAREPLMMACELTSTLGAIALEKRATTELLAAGARPRRKALSGVGALTASEARIAELVGSGLTNRQVAEQLFVTPKAVEFHLANVYRKLQIHGRKQLAGALGA